MSTRLEIVRFLADGNFHSGSDIGRSLGISRAAVAKHIKKLVGQGLTVHRVTGRGYRLATPITLLDAEEIRHYLEAADMGLAVNIEVLHEVESTSDYLLQTTADTNQFPRVCIAEIQNNGRGRRGRPWFTMAYTNITLSISWKYESGPANLAGLSLAAGSALLHALKEYGITGLGLKWPNDVLYQDRKLAGLLVDIAGEATGPTHVVLGIGINGRLSTHDIDRIDQPCIDLNEILHETIDRNRLAAITIKHLLQMFIKFEQAGLSAFKQEWEENHIFHGKRVQVVQMNNTITGIVEGVDTQGSLIVRGEDDRLRVLHSGEISIQVLR